MKVVFENQGIIETRAFSLMGVNVKESDNPFGYFGSGLKYGIATLMRYGQSVKVYCDDKTITFERYEDTFRGEKIELVRMIITELDSITTHELGYSTSLGKNWKLWMAYRELYCNCMDENGKVYTTTEPVCGEENKTKIVVEGDQFLIEHNNRHNFILQGEPMYVSGPIEVFPQSVNGIFYKRIRVLDLQKSRFPVNYTNFTELTEDRTLKDSYNIMDETREALIKLRDKDLIYRILTCDQDDWFHFDFSYEDPSEMSSEFEDVIVKLIRDASVDFNESAKTLVDKRRGKKEEPTDYQVSILEQKMLDKAVNFCKDIGYPIAYPIYCKESLGMNVYGLANTQEKKIWIARDCFGMGTKFLAMTLLEENIHIKYGYADVSRNMQNFLFNIIGSLGEQLLGEPL